MSPTKSRGSELQRLEKATTNPIRPKRMMPDAVDHLTCFTISRELLSMAKKTTTNPICRLDLAGNRLNECYELQNLKGVIVSSEEKPQRTQFAVSSWCKGSYSRFPLLGGFVLKPAKCRRCRQHSGVPLPVILCYTRSRSMTFGQM